MAIMLNHREAMRCCAQFPADRLLTETDSPYQSARGKMFSTYADLDLILPAMAALRREAGNGNASAGEMEKIIETNFCNAYNLVQALV
jgi:Tat protein secretion system quality control protein TatD with DNase activity